MLKSKSELWDLCKSCEIITKKCAGFQSIPFRSYGDISLHQEFLSIKKRHNYAKKQIRVMGLVPIILDNHREQVCGVSIHSLK
jgi:hypothetical protein